MNNETLLKEFMQKVWNEKDADSIAKYIAPAYTIHIDTGDRWEGKTLTNEEFKERLNDSFGPFPDMKFDIQTCVADGDYVAITWIMTGTNLGNIGNIPATKNPIKTFGATIYHFKDGKICGHSQVFDRTTVMKQLGFFQ